MKKLKNLDWTSIIVESVLIVLSILLALAINQYRDYKKQESLRIETLSNIKIEIENNIADLEQLIDSHKNTSARVEKFMAELNPADIEGKSVTDIIFSLDKIIIKAVSLNNTAWETARLTNAVSLIDYQQIQSISKVYNLQKISVDRMWELISSFLLSKENFETDNTALKLKIFNSYLIELYRQEINLKLKLEDTLKEL